MMEALIGFAPNFDLLLILKILIGWLGISLAGALLFGRVIRDGQRPPRPRSAQLRGSSAWFGPEDRSRQAMGFECRFRVGR